MKKIHYLLFMMITFSVLLISSCQNEKNDEMNKKAELTQEELVARGKYLIEVGGCHDCHSPKTMIDGQPVPDGNRLLSGHPSDQPLPEYDKSLVKDWALFTHSTTAAVGPWGISFSANLTSDGTGIGNWTFEQFKNALTKGWYKGLEGGRPIMPPMPWQNFHSVTDEDLRAMFEYLKSTTPVNNVPPAYIPPDQM